MNRKLDSFEKTLLKFRLLVRDLSLGPPIPASERFRLQGLRDYSWAFDQKFLGLRLMHSLCKEAAQKQDLIAVIYFESFLYFVSSALDVLASITVYFYPKDGKTLSRQVYFKDQMNETFLKSPNINPDYAKLLSENRRWIEDALDKRDAHAHKASPLMAIEKDGRPIIEKRHRFDDKTPGRKREFEDMLRCIDGTLAGLHSFLEGYVEVHRKRFPPSESAKADLESLERDLILSNVPPERFGCPYLPPESRDDVTGTSVQGLG